MAERPLHPQLRLAASRRELLIGAACSLAAGTAFALKPRHHVAFLGDRKLEELVPKNFAQWNFVAASGLVLPPQDQLRDQVYSQLLTRTYSGPDGTSIMLLIAYSGAQDGVVQIHRPEVCYPASGFQLVQNQQHTTRLANHSAIPSRFIVAEDSVRREMLIYWTRTGRAFPRKWAEQRWAIFEQNIQGDIPDGLLVRISSTDQDAKVETLDRFARDLFEHAGPLMQQVLVGDRPV